MREHLRSTTSGSVDSQQSSRTEANPLIQLAMRRRMIQRKAEPGGADAAAGDVAAGAEEAEGDAPTTAGGGAAAEGGAEAEEKEEGKDEAADAGQPLPEKLQQEMSKALSADFAGIKIHTDEKAAQLAKKMGARAFTQGADIYFADSAYNPDSPEGKELITHELTHAVQNGAAPKVEAPPHDTKDGAAGGAAPEEQAPAEEAQPKLEVSSPDDAAEREADAVATQVAAGGRAQPKASTGADLHRDPDAAADKGGDKAAGNPGGDKAAPGADAPKVNYPPGTTGILKGEATVNLGGADVKLNAGTVLKVVGMEPDKLTVKVYSGHEGKEGKIDAQNFQQQPGVAIDENSGKDRDDVYKDFGKAALWGADGPKPDDVAQGFIGDCFLMAAMGAVAASNPGAIKALFSPQESGAGSYTVSLFKKDDTTGDLVQHAISVDTAMPAQNDASLSEGAEAGPDTKLAYGGNGKTTASAKLWPSLIEKAYATLNEGFAEIGEGGYPSTAMEALTGVESQDDAMPKEKEVLDQFKGYQKDGKAVCVATLGSMEHKAEKAFKEAGGEYKAQLTTKEGDAEYVELVQSTLEVRDDVSKNKFTAGDDGKGKLVSPDLEDSSVDYASAKASMKFKDDKKPESPDNLTAEYDYRGRISKDLEVFAHHAYIFEKVEGQNLIFKNPWGTWHPHPIPVDQFLKLFSGISYNQVPKPEEGPPGGG
jgi:hypothetical protein